MTDLIVHIGMPKTGTTTLQSNIFTQLPAYLGKDKYGRCLSGTRREAQWLVSLMNRHFRYGTDDALCRDLGRWRDHCLELYRGQKNDHGRQSRIILSEERLAMWPVDKGNVSKWPITTGLRVIRGSQVRQHPSPVVAFLKDAGKDLWPHGRIRVLLTLRNQPDWLASHYSQLSNRIPGASQKDFERRLEGIIREPDPFLDWSAWVDNITLAVGKENTCVLPMELMQSRQYWERLGDFLGLDRTHDQWEASASDARNVRPKKTPDTWALRPMNTKKLLSPHHGETKGAVSELALNGLRRIEPLLRPLFSMTIDRNREKEITLSPKMRGRVREVFRSGNERLAKFLESDLSGLGY